MGATVLVGFLLAACGAAGPDDDSPPTGGDTAPATADQETTEPEAADAAGADCTATDARLPEAADRDLVALLPVPDSLTDAGDTFDVGMGMAVSGQTNADVDPEGAVSCIDDLADELGWDVVHRSDDESINTANGHTVVATHPELPDLCLNASLFASAHTPVVAGDSGSRMELSVRELSEGLECAF